MLILNLQVAVVIQFGVYVDEAEWHFGLFYIQQNILATDSSDLVSDAKRYRVNTKLSCRNNRVQARGAHPGGWGEEPLDGILCCN